MLISKDTEKDFDKIWHPLTIITLQKVGIEGKYLNIIKSLHIRPTADTPLNGEKQKILALRSGPREGSLLSPFLFRIIMDVLSMEIIEEEEEKKNESKL